MAFQPKSLLSLASNKLRIMDVGFRFCVWAHATQAAAIRRVQYHHYTLLVGHKFVVMVRWAEDFKRVYMEGREPIPAILWDTAAEFVRQHPNPYRLLPAKYLDLNGRADAMIKRVHKCVAHCWRLADKDLIPRFDAKVPSRRPVDGLHETSVRECLLHRYHFYMDERAEIRCPHDGGTNLVCWQHPWVAPRHPSYRTPPPSPPKRPRSPSEPETEIAAKIRRILYDDDD